MIADVPVGAFLSGGMDSSLIVALMADLLDEPVPTFAIGVAEEDFNELPYARRVAAHCGADHREEVATPDLLRLLSGMIHHLDEPSDPIAACFHHAARLAARHVKVVLTGDGGDELFAGFDRYYGFRWAGLYGAIPSPLRRYFLGPVWRALPDSAGYKNFTQRARWLHTLAEHHGARRYAEATIFFRFGEDARSGLFTADVAERLMANDPTETIVEAFDATASHDDLDRMLYADIRTRLPEHSLMLSDRMTMAHGLEARSPFLDHHLAEFVARLPSNLKMRGRKLKYVMRQAARGLLPPDILERPEQGFMFPLGYWMRGELLEPVRRVLAQSSLVAAGVFRAEAIESLLAESSAGRDDHHVRLWMLLNAEIWYRMYLEGESTDDLAARLGAA